MRFAASASHHLQAIPHRHDVQAAPNRHEQGAYDAQPQTRSVLVEPHSLLAIMQHRKVTTQAHGPTRAGDLGRSLASQLIVREYGRPSAIDRTRPAHDVMVATFRARFGRGAPKCFGIKIRRRAYDGDTG